MLLLLFVLIQILPEMCQGICRVYLSPQPDKNGQRQILTDRQTDTKYNTTTLFCPFQKIQWHGNKGRNLRQSTVLKLISLQNITICKTVSLRRIVETLRMAWRFSQFHSSGRYNPFVGKTSAGDQENLKSWKVIILLKAKTAWSNGKVLTRLLSLNGWSTEIHARVYWS